MADPVNSSTLVRKQTASTLSQPDGSVAVAVLQASAKNSHTMIKIEKQKPLVNVVSELCETWKLQDPSSYQLQFDEQKISPPPIYITEENRDRMANGDLLKLDFSPQKMSSMMADGFDKGNISNENIQRLAQLSSDVTFAEHFVTENGFTTLTKFIVKLPRQGQLSSISGPVLSAFVNIMDHSIVSWETITQEFIENLLWHLEDRHKPEPMFLKCGLTILNRTITNSPLGKSLAAEAKIGVNQFISTLKTRDIGIQVSCISLINTILEVSSEEQQTKICKQLLSQPARQVIWESIFTAPIGEEMAHQLYSLQTRLVNLLSDRLNGAIKVTDPAAMKEVTDLRRIAFDDEVESQTRSEANATRDFTKLGFRNPAEPLMVSSTKTA